MNGYRKELKYIVTDDVLLDVRNRISSIMQIDEHQKGDYYKIRSIYLDTPDYRCLRENEAGISTRQKYRIRSYDLSKDKISAEIKIRHNETISKMSVDISEELLGDIVNRNVVDACNKMNAEMSQYVGLPMKERTMQRYMMAIAGEHFVPAVIVEYERCAYVYNPCNVRITFDRNITASDDFDRFFSKELTGVAVIEGGKHVLEIKYDEFLPNSIATVLSGMGLVRTSCSKYVRCVNALRGVLV